MRILMIADPFVAVPPAGYGGSERIIHLMCQGLAARGHRITLLAGPGSKDYGGGVIEHRPPTAALASRAFRKIWFQFILARAAMNVDLVINHGRLDYLELLYRTAKPVVHWFHTPLTGREAEFVRARRRAGDHFVGVSRNQVAQSASTAPFHVIYNAVDTGVIPFFSAPGESPYVAFLGRLTPQKGVHLAIDAARRAGVKLVIGGNLPGDRIARDYFEQLVQPQLGPLCVWNGPYDEAARVRILSGASALLFPIQGAEAFGLVMIEALAAGVPVIATRRESTPEVIEPGRNGFLCDSAEEMAAAIARVGEISRADCRASVAERFGLNTFLNQVEDLIAQVHAA